MTGVFNLNAESGNRSSLIGISTLLGEERRALCCVADGLLPLLGRRDTSRDAELKEKGIENRE